MSLEPKLEGVLSRPTAGVGSIKETNLDEVIGKHVSFSKPEPSSMALSQLETIKTVLNSLNENLGAVNNLSVANVRSPMLSNSQHADQVGYRARDARRNSAIIDTKQFKRRLSQQKDSIYSNASTGSNVNRNLELSVGSNLPSHQRQTTLDSVHDDDCTSHFSSI